MARKRRRWRYAVVLIAAAAIAVAILLIRSTQSARAQPQFVGAARCSSCHRAEYALWKESHHAHAMQEARRSTVLGRFDQTEFSYAGVTSRFFRQGEKYFVTTEGADGKPHDFEIRYTFGVYPLQQYLVEFSGRRLQPLPVAWDSRPSSQGGQRWFHLQPGPRVAHTDEFHWTGRQQNWNYMCADCHSTGVRKGYNPATDEFRTRWSEINVACESCHGAGSRHTRWAAYPRFLRKLLWSDNGLPAQLTERRGVRWAVDTGGLTARRSIRRTTDREIETCAPCHSRRTEIADGHIAGSPMLDYYVPSLIVPGLYYADGQQRDEVYIYASFLQSRMYHAGVTCSDCHEPHSQRLRAPGNAVCAQCHLTTKYDTPAHTFHPQGNPGAACAGCHMSSTNYMQVNARLDHSIRIPRPDQTISLGVPNACNRCHTQRDARWAAEKVRAWYPTMRGGYQTFADAFAADERNADNASQMLAHIAGDSTQEPIVRASALARLAARPGRDAFQTARASLADHNPLVRHAALVVLDGMAPEQRVEPALPLLRDSSRAVRSEAARLLAPAVATLRARDDSDSFKRAANEFIASQQYNADRPENRTTLGIFFAQLGQLGDAENEYRGALRFAPRFGPAYVNLADVLRASGREAEAEHVLRDGLALIPGDAALHHALGLSLARSGRAPDAVAELGKAASLAPGDARFAYGYAVGLNSTGKTDAAIQVLLQAERRNPEDRNILFALATFYRDAGKRDRALKWAQELALRHPEDSAASELVRSLQ